MAYMLGVDVGTGGSRALLIDERGTIVASATGDHGPFAAPHIGWAEQDPHIWWKASSDAIRQCISQSGIPADQIAGVGFSGQMHGAVALDEAGEPVRHAPIWCDVRSDAQTRALNETIGRDRLMQLTCNPALVNFTLTKLLWIRDHEPQNFARIRSIMLPKDYVRFRLTAERATDVTDASGTLLFDVANRRWSHEVASAAGIDTAWLPKAYESADVSG